MVLAYMRLDVTASCSSSHEVQVISGIYIAAGVFNDRIIYQKTVKDVNLQWWSLRYDQSRLDYQVKIPDSIQHTIDGFSAIKDSK